jgi:organic radical activating enzyme
MNSFTVKDIDIDTPYPILSRMEFIERIHKRQEEIKDSLEIHDSGLSVWTKTPSGKTLSKGCQTCKAGTWQCLYVGKKCNVDCVYCAQGTRQEKMADPERPDLINDAYHIDEVKGMFNDPGAIWAGSNVGGIGYSGGEPFIYLDKVLNLAEFVSRYHGHIYQWIYTNGLLVTEDKLKSLYDTGVREIRFHIGATNFNKKVLNNLEMAKGIMDYVNVESPSNPELKEFLIDKRGIHWLEDVGVYQINLGELSTVAVNEMTKFLQGHKRVLEYFQKNQVYVCDSIIGTSVAGRNLSQIYISPAISREITYDIMKYTIENNIDILINDCSQDAKHIQRLQKSTNEQNADIMLKNPFQDRRYIQKLLEDTNKRKIDIIREHNKPYTRDYCMKTLIQDITNKDDKGYHLNLGELLTSIGGHLNINF